MRLEYRKAKYRKGKNYQRYKRRVIVWSIICAIIWVVALLWK